MSLHHIHIVSFTLPCGFCGWCSKRSTHKSIAMELFHLTITSLSFFFFFFLFFVQTGNTACGIKFYTRKIKANKKVFTDIYSYFFLPTYLLHLAVVLECITHNYNFNWLKIGQQAHGQVFWMFLVETNCMFIYLLLLLLCKKKIPHLPLSYSV